MYFDLSFNASFSCHFVMKRKVEIELKYYEYHCFKNDKQTKNEDALIRNFDFF